MILQRVRNRGIRLGTIFERAAARHPNSVLTVDHDLDVVPDFPRRATVAEWAELVDELAARLSAAGVRAEERVVVHKSHCFDITLLALALSRIGAIPALLSSKLDGETVAALVRRADRPVLLTDQAKLEQDLPEEVFELSRAVILAAGTHPQAVSLADYAGAPRVPAVVREPHLPAMITHTSGTTGVPKLAVHTGFSLESRYRPQATVAKLWLRGKHVVAINVSFVHSRMFTALPISLLHGHDVLAMREEDPEMVGALFAAENPTVLEAHPNTYMAWEELAEDPRRPLANVKVFSSTFDAIHPRTVRLMLEATARRRPLFVQMYGQSEIGPVTIRGYRRRKGADGDGRCVGIPFYGFTGAHVVRRGEGRPTKENPGFIEIASNGRIVTYYGEQERYEKQASSRVWWRMGDVGYRTRWGCVHLLDREVDVIEGFGSTLAVEDALFSRLHQLTEVVVVPGPDRSAVPVICTRGDAPIDPEAWRVAVRDLPPMAPPVLLRLDEVPHTATAKVRRLELARQLTERSVVR